MAHIENHHDDSPKRNEILLPKLYEFVLASDRSFWLFPEYFPCVVCYVKLRTRFGRTSINVLLMSLVLVDFLTVSIPTPIYLSLYNNCFRTQRSSHVERPAICEIFPDVCVVQVGIAVYSYLTVTARGIYWSIGDRISSSLAYSRHEQKHEENLLFAYLVEGIVIVWHFTWPGFL